MMGFHIRGHKLQVCPSLSFSFYFLLFLFRPLPSLSSPLLPFLLSSVFPISLCEISLLFLCVQSLLNYNALSDFIGRLERPGLPEDSKPGLA